MKSAQLEGSDGKALPEVILILNPKEALIIATAVKEYAERNKRNKGAKALKEAMELASIFF